MNKGIFNRIFKLDGSSIFFFMNINRPDTNQGQVVIVSDEWFKSTDSSRRRELFVPGRLKEPW